MRQSIFAGTLPGSRAAGWPLTGAAAIAAAVLFGPQMLRIATGATPHGPDVALFLAQPTVIQAYILTAATSLFIVGLNGNIWSLIHLLSGWTLVSLPIAVWAARRHNVNLHRRAMTGVFWGASIVAGGFAYLPGRLMWKLFMG